MGFFAPFPIPLEFSIISTALPRCFPRPFPRHLEFRFHQTHNIHYLDRRISAIPTVSSLAFLFHFKSSIHFISALPNPSMASFPPPSRKSVHDALGGGSVSDVLLWKRPKTSASVPLAATAMWFFFEKAGYSLLSLVANALLLLILIMFFWAKSASLLNRPLPPLPDLEVSEPFVDKVADAALVQINRVLAVAHDITFNGDFRLFLKVTSSLWLASYIGSVFSFFTLVYIGVLLSLTVPVLYDKYQDHVDEKLNIAHKTISTHYRRIDENFLSKIQKPLNKEKKTE